MPFTAGFGPPDPETNAHSENVRKGSNTRSGHLRKHLSPMKPENELQQFCLEQLYRIMRRFGYNRSRTDALIRKLSLDEQMPLLLLTLREIHLFPDNKKTLAAFLAGYMIELTHLSN